MVPHRSKSFFLLSLVVALIALALPTRADVAELQLMSQPGDFIGQGQTVDNTYTPVNSTFFFAQISGFVSGMPAYLSFTLGTVSGMPNTFTTLDFSTQQLGIPFQAGVYGLPGNTAQRAAFAQAGHAGLDVTFQNRGSNTLTGNFKVNSVQFFKDVSNNFHIGSLDVNFEQHSEGATPALFGHFTFFATGFGPSAVPEGGTTALLLLLALAAMTAMRPVLSAVRE